VKCVRTGLAAALFGALGWAISTPMRGGCPVDVREQSEIRVRNQSGDNIFVFSVADVGFADLVLGPGGEHDFCYDPAAMSFSFNIQSGTSGGYDDTATRWSAVGVEARGDSCLIYLLNIDPNGDWRVSGSYSKPCNGPPSNPGGRSGGGPTGRSGGGTGNGAGGGSGSSGGISQGAADSVNQLAKRLFDQVRHGQVTASAAISQLDSAGQRAGIAGTSEWRTFRNNCAGDLQRAEQSWRSDQDRNRQQEASRVADQQAQAFAQQQEQQRRALEEQQRKAEELRKFQADVAAANEALRKRGEELERQRKAELQRKLDELNERNRQLIETNQNNQRIVSESFGAGVASREGAVQVERSAMVGKVVGSWKPPRTYGNADSAGLDLVDPFAAAAPSAASPPARAVEVDANGEIALEYARGAPGRRILLASADAAFRPIVCEPLPAFVRAAIEPVLEADRRPDRPPYQFVLALNVAKRPSASSSKQAVRIATGLPMQPIVEVMLVITRK